MTKEYFLRKWFEDDEHFRAKADLESVIQQAIAEHEQGKWKKYPENVPGYGTYIITVNAYGQIYETKAYYEPNKWWADGVVITKNVIAFREQNPYKEDKP